MDILLLLLSVLELSLHKPAVPYDEPGGTSAHQARWGCETALAVVEAPATTHYSTTGRVVITFSDNEPAGCDQYGLPRDFGSLTVVRNGVDVTSYFEFDGNDSFVAAALPLHDDTNNQLTASFAGWDQSGSPRTDNATAQFVVDATPPLLVSLDPNGPLVRMADCTEPCGAAQYRYATPPYYSLDVPRSVTLVYNGDASDIMRNILVDLAEPDGAPVPDDFRVRVLSATTGQPLRFANGDSILYYRGRRAPIRLNLAVAVKDLGTGVHPVDVLVSARYGTHLESSAPQRIDLLVLTEQVSGAPVARGWSVSGIARLRFLSNLRVLLTNGDGSAGVFTSCGQYCFVSPPGETATLVGLANGTFELRHPDGSVVALDALGRSTSSRDREGRTVQYTYHPTRTYAVTSVSDPFRANQVQGGKARFIFVYGPNGLQSMTEPGSHGEDMGGRASAVVTDGDGHLLSITNPQGLVTSFGYDAEHRLRFVAGHHSDTVHHHYDPLTAALDSTVSPAVHVVAGGGTLVSARPGVRLRSWKRAQVARQATSPGSLADASPLDSIYSVLTDAGGHSTTIKVDAHGRAVYARDALGGVTTASYSGRYRTSYEPPSGQGEYMSVSGGRILSRRAAGAPVATQFHYGAREQVDSIWGGSRVQRMFLDSASGRVDSLRFDGKIDRTTRYDYDGSRRLWQIRDPDGHATAFRFDPVFGNTDTVRRSDGTFKYVRYDSIGRVQTVEKAGGYYRRYVHDALNRLRAVYARGDTLLVSYEYQGAYLTAVRDGRGNKWRREYNAAGWLTREHDAADSVGLTRYSEYRYDADGMVVSFRNQRGQWLHKSYDVLHRITARWGAGITADSFAYLPDRRSTRMWNAHADIRAYLRADGWVDSVATTLAASGQRFVRFQRPDQFSRLQLQGFTTTAPVISANRSFQYAMDGSVKSIQVGGQTIAFGYANDGARDTVTWQEHGIRRVVERSPAHLPTAVRLFSGPTLLAEHLIGYDSSHRQVALTLPSTEDGIVRSGSFGYDNAGRLRRDTWTRGAPCQQLYQVMGYLGGCTFPTWEEDNEYFPDRTANMDSIRVPFGGVHSRGSYAASNRLVSWIDASGGRSLNHDDDGNRTSDSSASGAVVQMFWSADHRLDSLRANGSTRSFGYDPSGRLVAVKSGSQLTRQYVWDGERVLLELDAAGNRIAEYVYPGTSREVLGILTGSTNVSGFRAVLQDLRGSILQQRNASGPIARAEYASWRRVRQSGDTTAGMGWQGYFAVPDVPGLLYARHRWYDERSGRFLSVDPVGAIGEDNLYSLGGGDPVNGMDPLGLCTAKVGDSTRTIEGANCPESYPHATCPANQTTQCLDDMVRAIMLANPWATFVGASDAPPGAFRHMAIAQSNGERLRITELRGWEVVGFPLPDLIRTNKIDILWNQNDVRYDGLSSYEWVMVGTTMDSYFSVADAIGTVGSQYQGQTYIAGDSNQYIYAVLREAGITLTSEQQKVLGCTPTGRLDETFCLW